MLKKIDLVASRIPERRNERMAFASPIGWCLF